ncbi:MAG: hypothetical protein HOP16_03915 [Acidobacteria bacterium]|nr:hypothetical protein [Acidobacteriota bacterium]
MNRVVMILAILLGQAVASCAQTSSSAADRTADRIATNQMIQSTWDVTVKGEVDDAPGGPIAAAMLAGFVKWKAQLATSDNDYWLRRGKDQVEYALKIGLIDARVKADADAQAVVRSTPDLARADRDRRIKFGQALTSSDASTIVAAASKLDPKVVAEWTTAREAVKKRVVELLAANTELRSAVADPNASDPEVQKSRTRLAGLLSAAGWKGK